MLLYKTNKCGMQVLIVRFHVINPLVIVPAKNPLLLKHVVAMESTQLTSVRLFICTLTILKEGHQAQLRRLVEPFTSQGLYLETFRNCLTHIASICD